MPRDSVTETHTLKSNQVLFEGVSHSTKHITAKISKKRTYISIKKIRYCLVLDTAELPSVIFSRWATFKPFTLKKFVKI